MSKISNLKDKLKKMGYTKELISVYIKVLTASNHTYIGDEEGEISLGLDFISSGKIKPDYSRKPNGILLYGEDWDGCQDVFAYVRDPIDPIGMGYPNCEREKVTIASMTEELGIIATQAYPNGVSLSNPTIKYYSSMKWVKFLDEHPEAKVFDVLLDSSCIPDQTIELDRSISYGLPFKPSTMSFVMHNALQKRRKKEKAS